MESYDLFKYWKIASQMFLKENIKRIVRIVFYPALVLILLNMVNLYSEYELAKSKEILDILVEKSEPDLNKLEPEMQMLLLRIGLLNIFMFFGYVYVLLYLYYRVSSEVLDIFGYHVEKQGNEKIKLFFNIPGSVVNVFYTLFYFVVHSITVLLNWLDKKMLLMGIVGLTLVLLGSEILSSIGILLLIALIIYNTIRFFFAYDYFLTTTKGLIGSFKTSYDATNNKVLKNGIFLFLLFIVIILIANLFGTLKYFPEKALSLVFPETYKRLSSPEVIIQTEEMDFKVQMIDLRKLSDKELSELYIARAVLSVFDTVTQIILTVVYIFLLRAFFSLHYQDLAQES